MAKKLRKRIRQRLIKNNFIVSLWRGYKKLIIPGFGGMPIHSVLVKFWEALTNGALSMRAAAVSYRLFVSVFPAIIFFFTLIAYTKIPNFQAELMVMISEFLPANTFLAVQDTIIEIITRQNVGLLSVTLLTSLIFGTNGMMGIVQAFNRAAFVIDTRPNIRQRSTAVILTFIFYLIIIISVALGIILSSVLKYLISQGILESNSLFNLIQWGRWLVLIVILYLAICVIYFIAPCKQARGKFFSTGALFMTIMFSISTMAFNAFLQSFDRFNTLYGSIGTVLAILVFINIFAHLLLIGFDLNISVLEAKKQRENIK